EVYQVPWRNLLPGEAAPAGILVLYWFPTSSREQHAAELQSSRPLTQAAARCVGMAIAGVDNAELRERYKVGVEVSTVVLSLAADGSEIGRVLRKYGRPADPHDVARRGTDALKPREKPRP